MQFLDYSQNPWMVVTSLAVALMAGFTGLSLTSGLSTKSDLHRKLAIAMASVALGGGIWSMHFVAMLGLQMPILFYYDAAITLTSALVAILMVGVALLILHFGKRTPALITLAGTIVGIGIAAMHYLGMSGLELCQAVYQPMGVAISIIASCILSIGAFWIAYGKRTQQNIILGTLCFGLSVFVQHFVAIWNTRFVALDVSSAIGPLIGNETMAIGVVLTSFAICGTFLLTGVTFLKPVSLMTSAPFAATDQPSSFAPEKKIAKIVAQIPYEIDGQTRFIEVSKVAVIRADGHYTHLYTKSSKLFCVWTIKDAERRLAGGPFLKCHRSYLINPSFVTSFQRLKDNGVCHFDDIASVSKVPVSRSMLADVREALGL
jgi:NO-binding membrane sensor protein with MHYT domain